METPPENGGSLGAQVMRLKEPKFHREKFPTALTWPNYCTDYRRFSIAHNVREALDRNSSKSPALCFL